MRSHTYLTNDMFDKCYKCFRILTPDIQLILCSMCKTFIYCSHYCRESDYEFHCYHCIDIGNGEYKHMSKLKLKTFLYEQRAKYHDIMFQRVNQVYGWKRIAIQRSLEYPESEHEPERAFERKDLLSKIKGLKYATFDQLKLGKNSGVFTFMNTFQTTFLSEISNKQTSDGKFTIDTVAFDCKNEVRKVRISDNRIFFIENFTNILVIEPELIFNSEELIYNILVKNATSKMVCIDPKFKFIQCEGIYFLTGIISQISNNTITFHLCHQTSASKVEIKGECGFVLDKEDGGYILGQTKSIDLEYKDHYGYSKSDKSSVINVTFSSSQVVDQIRNMWKNKNGQLFEFALTKKLDFENLLKYRLISAGCHQSVANEIIKKQTEIIESENLYVLNMKATLLINEQMEFIKKLDNKIKEIDYSFNYKELENVKDQNSAIEQFIKELKWLTDHYFTNFYLSDQKKENNSKVGSKPGFKPIYFDLENVWSRVEKETLAVNLNLLNRVCFQWMKLVAESIDQMNPENFKTFLRQNYLNQKQISESLLSNVLSLLGVQWKKDEAPRNGDLKSELAKICPGIKIIQGKQEIDTVESQFSGSIYVDKLSLNSPGDIQNPENQNLFQQFGNLKINEQKHVWEQIKNDIKQGADLNEEQKWNEETGEIIVNGKDEKKKYVLKIAENERFDLVALIINDQ